MIFHRRYDIGFLGLERLHPFDSRKYGRAWSMILREVGPTARAARLTPAAPVSAAELTTVHTPRYLDALRDAGAIVDILEVPPLRLLGARVLDLAVLRPMRWATAGTVMGARQALAGGAAINLGGGYHHAGPDGGEGFCVYADVGLAVRTLWAEGALPADASVAHIDLDAHLGNGVAHVFADEPRARLFDMHNGSIYPDDPAALRRVDHALPLARGADDATYLDTLRGELPGFLDAAAPAFAVYNAGTDVLDGDRLGQLSVSASGVLARDLFVLDALSARGIPWLMVTSGGYTAASAGLIAQTTIAALRRGWGGPIAGP